MKTAALSTLLSLTLGSVMIINGVAINANDVLADAHKAVNAANIHQIATVLELYYSDHNEYPDVQGGKELINLLKKEEYIRNRPLNPSVFGYQATKNGQDYSLKLIY